MQKKIYFLLIATSLSLAPLIFFGMKYKDIHEGYCATESRFLSDSEKIELAIRYLIHVDPPALQKEIYVNGALHLKFEKPKNVVRYSSVSVFKNENPNCCEVSSNGKSGEKISFFQKISGGISDFVHITYKIKYYDENSKLVSKDMVSFLAVSNCGHVWSGI